MARKIILSTSNQTLNWSGVTWFFRFRLLAQSKHALRFFRLPAHVILNNCVRLSQNFRLIWTRPWTTVSFLRWSAHETDERYKYCHGGYRCSLPLCAFRFSLTTNYRLPMFHTRVSGGATEQHVQTEYLTPDVGMYIVTLPSVHTALYLAVSFFHWSNLRRILPSQLDFVSPTWTIHHVWSLYSYVYLNNHLSEL